MKIILMALYFFMFALSAVQAEVNASSPTAVDAQKETTWWQQRKDQLEIYYPHKVHLEVMKEKGDPCLLCHPFNKNTLRDADQLKQLNVIANEPLQAICHDCHVVKLTANSRCTLCHYDLTAIWPEDHKFNYINRHANDARMHEEKCRSCHVDLSFCSDCHFNRDSTQRRVHMLGYRTQHGIEARINTAQCGRCHEAGYCADCHRQVP